MNKKYIVPSTELQIIAASMIMQGASPTGQTTTQGPIDDSDEGDWGN